MNNQIAIIKEKEIAPSKKNETVGFIKKVEDQVDMLGFVHFDMNYGFKIENPTFRCPFCGSTIDSFKIDKKRKQFRCTVCGLNGGLVLFIMLYHKTSLKAALQYIATLVSIDASVIPYHLLITQKK